MKRIFLALAALLISGQAAAQIPSGKTDQYVYFYAESTTGGPKTGLSSFTVYRSRNGAAAASYTTPTVNETDSSNMPGVYELLVDEDTTIASTSDSENYALRISATGMVPVLVQFELYRNAVTSGQTLTVASGVGSANVTQIDAQATSGNNATLNLKQLNIVNSTGSAIVASASGSNGHGIVATGNGTGEGFSITGGATGHGLQAIGGSTSGSGFHGSAATSGDGMTLVGLNDQCGLNASGEGDGHGILGQVASATAGSGMHLTGIDGLSCQATGVGGGIVAHGGNTDGPGIYAQGNGEGEGFICIGGSGGSGGTGFFASGAGGGHGFMANAGATGNGFYTSGGATSGDGFFADSPGTGVDIRGNITGNITGTLSGGVNVTQLNGDSQSLLDLKDFADAGYDPTTDYVSGMATIGDGAITSDTFANNAINSGALAADAIGASELATDAIGAAEVATDAIGAAELAANSITSSEVADDSIDAGAIAADAIGASELAANSITSSEVADDSIDAGALAASSITSSETADSAWQELIELTFTYDATATYAGANAGSMVKQIADNSAGAALTTDAIAEAMFTYDATATYGTANAGSVVKQIADNAAGASLTEAGIADAIWDELLSGHTTSGSAGERLGRIPNAAAGASGGLFIAGSNAATTVNFTGNLSGSVGSVATGGIAAASFAAGAIDAAAIAADAIAASEIAADAIGASELATDAIAAAELAAGALAEINTEVDTALADVRLDELLSADSDIDGAAPPTVGSVFHEALTKTPGSFTYDQTTDALEAIRDNSQTAVQAAIEANHLDHLLAVDYDPTSKPGVATALLNELVQSSGGVSQFTANALAQAPGAATVLQSTTIATLVSQTSFTLTAGSADDNAYDNAVIIITDSSTSTQKAVARILDYEGTGREVTLKQDPGIFTMAVGDTVTIIGDAKALTMNLEQAPVPVPRTFILRRTADGLEADTKTIREGENSLVAVDFREDLSTNGRLINVDNIEITTGTAGGVVFDVDEAGVDKTQAKFRIAGVTAGDYEITVTVSYDDSDGGGTTLGVIPVTVE